jgi:hypothetical protein
MTGRRLGVLVALAPLVGGCGAAGPTHSPDLSRLPLTPGARVVAQVRSCDHGANAFCALELVVVDSRYATSADVVAAEHAQLRRHGWTGANAETGDEHAADSPGHKLRVTYATAFLDLVGIARGFIRRPHPISLALSRALSARASAMSVMLELGSG